MKSLSEYVKEQFDSEVHESKECKSMTFNFNGMDDCDEILKQFGEIKSASVNDKEVEVLCDANIDELKKVYDILKKYSDSQRKSQHRASDEQYAQKTIKFENKVNELAEMIDTIEHPEEKEPEKDEKKDDKKEEE